MRILHISDIHEGRFGIKANIKDCCLKKIIQNNKEECDEIKKSIKNSKIKLEDLISNSQYINDTNIDEQFRKKIENLNLNYQPLFKKMYDYELGLLKETLIKCKPVDIIIISGDLISTGVKEEFNSLKPDFFLMLKQVFLESTPSVPLENWIISPGNHDLTWITGDPKKNDTLDARNARFDEYISFCKSFCLYPDPYYQIGNPESIFSKHTIIDPNTQLSVQFVSLNSCMDIFNKDTNRDMNLSKDYFLKIAENLNDPYPKIMITHHRIIDISPKNNHALKELADKNIVLALSGDFHKTSEDFGKTDQGIYYFYVGSLFGSKLDRTKELDEVPRQFCIYDIDFKNENFSITPFSKIGSWGDSKTSNLRMPEDFWEKFKGKKKPIILPFGSKKENLKIFAKYKFNTILQDAEVIPFRPDGPKISDFEKGDWIYVPNIIKEICKNVRNGEVVILGGGPATGKSVIARYVGFKLSKKRSVYYIDFLTLTTKEKDTILESLDKIIPDPNDLFIFENIHDPEIGKISNRTNSFVDSLKAFKQNIQILLTTRGDTSKKSLFTWIEEKNRINLNKLTDLNKELIEGIIDKFNIKRVRKGLKPLEWKLKDNPENLWLLGWTLRFLEDFPNQKIVFTNLEELNEALTKEIETYYEKNFPELSWGQIKVVLLIISVLSKYETYIEENFIKNVCLKQFKDLHLENIEKIITSLKDKKEILVKEVQNSPDFWNSTFEYRIPHIKLAKIIQDCYAKNEDIRKKLDIILDEYINFGKNSISILGYNFWLQGESESALKCFKLVEQENQVIKTLLNNKYKFEINVLNNHVILLKFSSYLLTTLPESITKLASLQTLNLGYNRLLTLPESIDNLKSLQTLDLHYNQLTTLPESIGKLSSLKELDLDYNQLSTLPKSIGTLTSLTYLNLESNQISTLPESIGKLSSLKELRLYNNKLTTLPESIGELTSLQTLGLSGNQLLTLPESIGELTSLQTLGLSGNQLTNLPESISNLTLLLKLNLANNQLTTLPESITQLKVLQMLGLSVNQLTTLTESIGKLSSLQTLWLSNNQLTTLSESIGQLYSSKELLLYNNKLTTLPESVGNLQSLQTLDLHYNHLTTLPKSIVNLSSLQKIDLSHNQLEVLPESIGNLKSLQKIDLSHNQLMVLPKSLNTLNSLKSLWIKDNPLDSKSKALIKQLKKNGVNIEDYYALTYFKIKEKVL